MKTTRLSLFIMLCVLFSASLSAQGHEERFEKLDVISYHFEIGLSDSSNIIQGKALVHIRFKKETEKFCLDLVYDAANECGMKVSSVKENGKDIPFVTQENKLGLFPRASAGSEGEYEICYSGIPSDGLIISKNKFGDRTFFGDNWPDRARHWLPLVDHPSDKALVEFTVTAP